MLICCFALAAIEAEARGHVMEAMRETENILFNQDSPIFDRDENMTLYQVKVAVAVGSKISLNISVVTMSDLAVQVQKTSKKYQNHMNENIKSVVLFHIFRCILDRSLRQRPLSSCGISLRPLLQPRVVLTSTFSKLSFRFRVSVQNVISRLI